LAKWIFVTVRRILLSASSLWSETYAHIHLLFILCRHFVNPDCLPGDFSFALSLVEHHKCKYVTATCYDSEDTLHQKYPQAGGILERFLTRGDEDPCEEQLQHEVANGLEALERPDATSSSSSEWEGFSPATASENSDSSPSDATDIVQVSSTKRLQSSENGNISFHASISAHVLPNYKLIRSKGPFKKIVFNFPHVGGLSADVNRQVRSNQELLVAFSKSCKPLLASKTNPARHDKSPSLEESDFDEEAYEGWGSDKSLKEADDSWAAGQVIISLFDGEPYTLWNIRDLARHSGFRVVTSFRFP
jgi:25S rRNA (uracil2634-N3)-methyltransferase